LNARCDSVLLGKTVEKNHFSATQMQRVVLGLCGFNQDTQ
jgi:hypothetical protein